MTFCDREQLVCVEDKQVGTKTRSLWDAILYLKPLRCSAVNRYGLESVVQVRLEPGVRMPQDAKVGVQTVKQNRVKGCTEDK